MAQVSVPPFAFPFLTPPGATVAPSTSKTVVVVIVGVVVVVVATVATLFFAIHRSVVVVVVGIGVTWLPPRISTSAFIVISIPVSIIYFTSITLV